jgi:diaminopimelate epimerase
MWLMRFAKGHGTENDFVLLYDPDAVLDIPASRVARLCDRRAGLGADGVLRVVRTKALADSEPAAEAQGAEWFMDYRNADGSIAEMCGNGVRVFARYLLEQGLAAAPEFDVATRAGLRRVRLADDGRVRVGMGPVRLLGEGEVRLGEAVLSGQRISVGNPHLACAVPGPVAEVDLREAPHLDPGQFPDGGNVEVFRTLAPGELEMRVHERGSGETRSCGTGIVAAAAAAAQGGQGTWRVRVPGGECTVDLGPEEAHLTGPAVIIAEGTTVL